MLNRSTVSKVTDNNKLDIPLDKPVTVVLDKEDRLKFFHDCKKIYTMSKTDKDVFCGIDFEFNMNWKTKKRYIGSMQIILVLDKDRYHDKSYVKPVYVLDPSRFSSSEIKKLIRYIFTSNVVKIFHGSDSLDCPYVFTELLKGKKGKFIRFMNSTVDTRFLCEITKRIRERIGDDPKTNRCSIYNALYDNDVVDKKLFDTLTVIGSKVNYNKRWEIDKLTDDYLIYSVYDIIYLYDLLEKISQTVLPCKQKECIDVLSVVNRLYRFHMLNYLGVTKISTKCTELFNSYRLSKDDIDKLNQQIMETSITEILYKSVDKTEHLTIYFEDVLSINTIRKNIMACLKVRRYDVNSDKLDEMFERSRVFKLMKGNNYILKLLDLNRLLSTNRKHVFCRQ